MRGHSSFVALSTGYRQRDFLEGGLEAGQVDFAVTLRRVGIALPHQCSAHEDRNVQCRSFDEIAVIQISGEGAWWHCVVATRLLARDAKRARERPQGNFDAGRKLGRFLFIVEIEVLHLSIGKAAGELSKQSGNIEIRAPWSRNDLLYLDLQRVARLRPVDEDRAGQRHGPARRPIRA